LRLEVLGSAGAVATPQPGCSCRVCVEARAKGVPYSRTGPSVFVHDAGLLVDTPEESRDQLVRAGIERVEACAYSHWHSDHVMGRRVFEGMTYDFLGWPPEAKAVRTTRVLVPERVALDFRAYLGTWGHLEFLEGRLGVVEVELVPEGASVDVGGLRLTPFALAEEEVYAFLLERDGRRALVAMDELHGWHPPAELRGLDLAYLPMGLAEHHPLTGERRIHPDHPVLRSEATFPQTLEVVRALGARRVVLSHVEEVNGLTHDDLREVAGKVRAEQGLEVEFAYDTMVVDV
jgi:phosphoribosyl 1,2-cyclic phosphate phosphodiesterase